jgi:hypothetical protein
MDDMDELDSCAWVKIRQRVRATDSCAPGQCRHMPRVNTAAVHSECQGIRAGTPGRYRDDDEGVGWCCC